MIPLLLIAAAGLLPDLEAAGAHVPARRTRADLSSYFSDADYPAEAIRRGEQGIVAYALNVDEAGRVSACRITESSGSAVLDEATCRILRERARFTPARDRRGRAVPDRVAGRTRWVLPPEATSSRALANLASYISDDDYPAEALRNEEQGTVEFVLRIGRDGTVSDCRIATSSNSASLDEATCRIMSARARFRPALDSAGNPTEDEVRARIRWVLPVADDVDFSAYISSADYPAEALRRREQGRVEISISLSADGSVGFCAVSRSSGSAQLDARTCDLIRARVHMMPSEDQARRGLPTMFYGYVDWVLPAS